MNKRIKKKLAKRVNIYKYSDYKIYKGFIQDFTIGKVRYINVYKLPMNKKWIFIKVYKDYYYKPIIEYMSELIYSTNHLFHIPNPAQADQMMMYANAMKDEFKLDKVSITNMKKLYATAVEEDGENNGETSNNKEEA